MKKAFFILFLTLILILVWNAAWWFHLYRLISSLSPSQPLSNLSAQSQPLSRWAKWYSTASLGLYRLPYLSSSYQLVQTTSEIIDQSLTLLEQLQGLSHHFLQGTPTNLDDWNQAWDQLASLNTQLKSLRSLLNHPHLTTLARLTSRQPKLTQLSHQLDQIIPTLSALTQLQPELSVLLGFTSRQHYLVLLQNNMELRPTGGYLGSFAQFWLENGALQNLSVEAIGVPDGKLPGYVEAPQPIVDFLHGGNTPGWHLKDSNWNPDFPQAFPTINWFFTQGKIEPIDHLIAINLIPVTDLLAVTGPIFLPDYNLHITTDNFYQHAQAHAETGFFAGSTQKRDFLGYFQKHLLLKLTDKPEQYLPQILPIILHHLNTKQILIASSHPPFAQWLADQNFDGGLHPISCPPQAPNCLPDYLHINEANLSINKANCCLDRSFSDDITIDQTKNLITHQLTFNFQNHNPVTPNPPYQWGGGYHAYIRLFTPSNALLLSIQENQQPLQEKFFSQETYRDKSVIGFLAQIPGGKSGQYSVTYQLPLSNPTSPDTYQLKLQKQSGIESIPWQINIRSDHHTSTWNQALDRDLFIPHPLKP